MALIDVSYQDLDQDQRRHLAAANNPSLMARYFPEFLPGSASAGTGTAPSFSLNNDSSFAPPPEKTVIPRDPTYPKFLVSDTFGLDRELPADLPADKKRAWLDTLLEGFGRYDFQFSYWAYQKKFISLVADFANIADTPFTPFRRSNFDACCSPFQRGQVHSLETDSDDPDLRVQKFSCGNKYCPWCGTKRRRSLAADYVSVAKECAVKYGMKRAWSLVFTLPETIENDLWERLVELRGGLAKLVKKAFGVKTRDNLGILIVSHPSGGSDIMRPRLHFHVMVFPLVFKNGSAPRFLDRSLLDLKFLRAGWAGLIGGGADPIQPEVKFFNLESEDDFAKIGHRLRYDLRSFALDFENAPVYHDGDLSEVILKCQKGSLLFWRKTDIEALAAAYVRYISRNTVQPYGWLQKIEKWRAEGYFDPVAVSDTPVPVESFECRIELVRKKAFSPDRGRVIWIKEEYCHFNGKRLLIGTEIPWY